MIARARFLRLALASTLLAGCATQPAVERAAARQGSAAVSAADPRAADAGRQMLLQGGTALDAALATLVALTVVEPASSGIGGGSFLVYHDAKSGLATYDGRETAPAAVTPGLFLGPDGKPPASFNEARRGGRSVGVPGNLAAMALAYGKHGKLPWAALFAPAIKLARDGFEVTPRFHGVLESYGEYLSATPARALYYQADGSPKPVGTLVRNPELAAYLEQVAANGPGHFYRGPGGKRLVAAVRAAPNPSTMTEADLAAYRAVERPPVCGTYRRYRVCGMAPPSSGGPAVYGILKMIERFDIAGLGKDNPRAWHLIAEAQRLAYADRAKWIADPAFVPVPTAGLMSDAYLRARSALISVDARIAKAEAGTPPGAPALAAAPDSEAAGTSHFSTADAAGNVAAMTSTIEAPFGSGVVVDGYMLNNELTDFNAVPDENGRPTANRVQPGKRPRSSMAPMIVYAPDGRPVLSVGAAGGATIIAQVVKAIIGVVDWKLSAQEAIALPQLVGMGDTVRVERGTFLEAMIPALAALGHKATATGLPLKANAVEWTPAGWRGGADPRSEGESIAFGQAVLEPK